jgi:hypothetical protein
MLVGGDGGSSGGSVDSGSSVGVVLMAGLVVW